MSVDVLLIAIHEYVKALTIVAIRSCPPKFTETYLRILRILVAVTIRSTISDSRTV